MHSRMDWSANSSSRESKHNGTSDWKNTNSVYTIHTKIEWPSKCAWNKSEQYFPLDKSDKTRRKSTYQGVQQTTKAPEQFERKEKENRNQSANRWDFRFCFFTNLRWRLSFEELFSLDFEILIFCGWLISGWKQFLWRSTSLTLIHW